MNTNLSESKSSLGQRAIKPLHELFLDELADMKDAEHQLTLAIPLLEKVARSHDLKTLLQIHLTETKGHLECVEQVAKSLGEKLTKRKCAAMKGLIKEGVTVAVKKLNSSVLDIALIAAAQKIEHYEIASYGALCAWAKKLGYTHEFALLTSILNQEKMADTLLTGVAKGAATLKELIETASLKNAGATSLSLPPQP